MLDSIYENELTVLYIFLKYITNLHKIIITYRV